MNRRNFFRNLFIGAVSAPAIAKALAEEPKPVADCYDCTALDFDSSAMRRAICERIANHNPYAGLTLAIDQNPLRFSL